MCYYNKKIYIYIYDLNLLLWKNNCIYKYQLLSESGMKCLENIGTSEWMNEWMSLMSPFWCVSLHKPEQIIFGMWVCCMHPHESTGTKTHTNPTHTDPSGGVETEAWPPIAESSLQLHQCCCFYLCAIHLESFLLPLPLPCCRRLLFLFFDQFLKRGPLLGSSFSRVVHHIKCARLLPLAVP